MSKKKKGGAGILWAIFFIIVAIITVAVIMRISLEAPSTNDFSLVYKNQYLLGSKSGFTLTAGDQIEVRQFDGNEDVQVKIYAIENENDIAFTLGNKDLTWSANVASADVTNAFNLTVSEKKDGRSTITLIDGGICDTIEFFAAGSSIAYKGMDLAGDYFRMIVTVGETSLSLDFSVLVSVASVNVQETVEFGV